jgi:hypothetical protein
MTAAGDPQPAEDHSAALVHEQTQGAFGAADDRPGGVHRTVGHPQ